VAGTVKARLIGDDAITFLVVLEVVIAAAHICTDGEQSMSFTITAVLGFVHRAGLKQN
jgi:hypothetical protein